MKSATLLLEDGTRYAGALSGYPKPVAGEVVFNTGMVGYTESLTDPSYRGQILCLTYPLVGNYGVPPAFESSRIQASALVVCELAAEYSHAGAEKSLPAPRRACRNGCTSRAFPASPASIPAR